MNVCNGFTELLCKVSALIRYTGGFGTETPRYHFHLTEYHFGMLYKVAVHRNAVLVCAEMHPVRLNIYNAVTLLQDENIRNDFRSGVALKGVIRQTDSAEQVGSLCDILSDCGIFLVHRPFARNKCHNAARSKFIKGLCKEVVVDQELVLVISLVGNFEIPERHIAHNGVKEAVGEICFLKALCGNRGLLIELLCDTRRNGIKLNAIDFTLAH